MGIEADRDWSTGDEAPQAAARRLGGGAKTAAITPAESNRSDSSKVRRPRDAPLYPPVEAVGRLATVDELLRPRVGEQ